MSRVPAHSAVEMFDRPHHYAVDAASDITP